MEIANRAGNDFERADGEVESGAREGRAHIEVRFRGGEEREEHSYYVVTPLPLLLAANDIPEFHPITKTSLPARRRELLVNIMALYLRLNRIKD